MHWSKQCLIVTWTSPVENWPNYFLFMLDRACYRGTCFTSQSSFLSLWHVFNSHVIKSRKMSKFFSHALVGSARASLPPWQIDLQRCRDADQLKQANAFTSKLFSCCHQ